MDKRLILYSKSDNLYYDCRTFVGKKIGHKYYTKSDDLINWIDDNFIEDEIFYFHNIHYIA